LRLSAFKALSRKRRGDAMPDRLLTLPNIFTFSRLPLSVILFVCISFEQWLVGLIIFAVAALTDWLDGFLARRLNQQSAIGRSLDPLIDKVMIGGTFIYLLRVDGAGLSEWIVTVVIGRELLITGLRGIMEALGVKFGADWLGKIKTTLQCVVIVVILVVLWLDAPSQKENPTMRGAVIVQTLLIYAMVLVTVASGAQYIIKAIRVWRV
jgi:CDP-diacylglycerol--glycerol-3-phosphate 3-phosphatidyltransferase